MLVCPELGCAVRLVGVLPEADVSGVDDVWITGCTCDARQVRVGELFAALDEGGRESVNEAVARGCAAVLSDRPLPDAGMPCCVVPNIRESHARLCQRLVGQPSRQLKLIGIAGAHGKTTTSCLIAGVLKAAGYGVGVLGDLGCLDGRGVEPTLQTTPPPERLAPLLARMVRNKCSHAVMEVSNRALDESYMAGVALDAVCVTNVARDQDERRAIGKIFEGLDGEGFAVLNADDPGSASYVRHLGCPVLTVGIRAAAEVGAVLVERHTSEQMFLLTAGSDTVPVRTKMIGDHHIYHCLEAAAVGLAYGIELTAIAGGLESVDYVPGRLERIECGQPFGVFLDIAPTSGAPTSGALDNAMATLRSVTSGQLICVVEQGARRTAAICEALASARSGDCVLIAGLGPDDRDVAYEWLYNNPSEL